MNTNDIESQGDHPRELAPKHLDAHVKAAVASVEPPIWLKESILQQGPRSKGTPLTVYLFRTAMAAALALGLFLAFSIIKMKGNNQLEDSTDLRKSAASYIVDSGFLLDYNEPSLESIRAWLSSQAAPNFSKLPVALTNLQPIGCKELEWRGASITLVCFHLEDDSIIHLFIGDLNADTKKLLSDLSTVKRVHGLETGGWETDGQIYLLSGSGPNVRIEGFLKSS